MQELTYPGYSDNADISVINDNFSKIAEAVETLEEHAANTDNPHDVTAADVGLGNVDNVKQATKAEFNQHVSDKTLHTKMVFGTYTGTGEQERTINIGFTPTAVEIYSKDGKQGYWCSAAGRDEIYGGLAMTGFPCIARIPNNNTVFEIVSGGFKVYAGSGLSATIRANLLNYVYYFKAYSGTNIMVIE